MNNDSKINSNIINYIFSKNKFSLSKKSHTIKDKDLDYCKNHSIKNNKQGFNFYGNNNKCYLYSNHVPQKKVEDSLLTNFSIKKFVKDKSQKYANPEQQSNPKYYFNELNHYNLESTGLLKKNDVKNLSQCMNTCINNPSCNTIMYFQQPLSCDFYDKIKLNKNKNNIYDSYTINQKINKNEIIKNNNIQEKKEKILDDNIKNNNVHNIHNVNNNNNYTTCFTNEIYKNYVSVKKNYDNICKKNFGDEYVFVNGKNNKNIINCDDDKVKILCKPEFIERFENYKDNNIVINSSYIYIYLSIFLGLLCILFLYF